MVSFLNKARLLVPERFSLVVQTLPVVAVVLLAKAGIDAADGSFITLTTLFGSIVAANVFLLGFLLAGTLADYKESEKLPSELAASIESIADECAITYQNKQAEPASAALQYLSALSADTWSWFHKERRTVDLLGKIQGLNDYFLAFEPLTQPNFIVRLKQEQSTVRRLILRIDTIRDTSFVSVAYTIAELGTALLVFGLMFARIEPFYEAVFYVGAVTFLLVYLIFLIKDLDNPFDYYEGGGEAAHVSLKPIEDLQARMKLRVEGLQAAMSEPDPLHDAGAPGSERPSTRPVLQSP